MAEICAGCGHAPHYGRCFFVATPPGRYVECQCKERRQPHEPDNSTHAGDAGLSVAGLRMDHAEAQRQLTACRTELAEIAADIQRQIRAIGQTFTDGAARLEGARK